MSVFENHYNSYINSQLKSLKSRLPKEKRAGNPFVTISRQTGAYSFTIAKALCEYLNKNERRSKCIWAAFDRELIKTIAQEHNLPETVLPYLSETTVSEIQDLVEETLGLHPSHNSLVHKTGQTILHLARLGYCIMVGRAANIITAKLPGGVHIRLISPWEKRLEHIQEYYKMTEPQAKEFILTEDRDRKNYVKKYFGKDIDDPLLYDMVINVDKLKPAKTIQMIGELVFKKFSPH
ncbi:MAG: cytidylate kinase-like family protein [Candidatus Omnitrophica bacterium]|nr:cytidylate kinase-like family protein [Candidatus Omnitrophota bacterium]